MSRGKKPDPRKQKTGSLYASYMRVANGQQERAYKAGELYGCNGHRTDTHQPCARDITDGELSCPYCSAGLDIVWRGFVPLWDRDWSLRYVLIGQDHLESTDQIPWRAQVTVSRAKNPISPLVVREEQCLTRALPAKPPWSAEVDMLAICLTLWQHDALTQWFRQTHGTRPGVGAAVESQAAKMLDGEPRKLGDFIGLALGDKAEQVNRLKKNDDFAKTLAKPSKNGKPH